MASSKLIFLSSETGEVLLTKSYGVTTQMSLPMISSLNSAHLFAEQLGAKIISTVCGQLKIVWRDYENRVKIILITDKVYATDKQLSLLLDYIFNSLIIVTGLDEVTNTELSDKWRLKIEGALSLVDQLMEDQVCLFCHHTGVLDVLTPSGDMKVIKECLDTFAEMAQTKYGCVMLDGVVCTATDSWFKLDSMESGLLSHLIVANSVNFTTCADVPVYLPVMSSRVPHRLVSFHLFGTCVVSLLVGSDPPLHVLLSQVTRYWGIVYEPLRIMEGFKTCGAPKDMTFNDINGCAGCLLVNTDKRVSLFFDLTKSREDIQKAKELDVRQCLIEFIDSLSGKYGSVSEGSDNTVCKEMYISCECYKCYGIHEKECLLYAVFNSDVSTFNMRSLSNALLHQAKKKLLLS